MALYAPGQPIEPRSIRTPLRLEARRGPGHVPSAARHAHGDLHGSGAAAAAGHAACAIGAHVRIHRRPCWKVEISITWTILLHSLLQVLSSHTATPRTL